MNDFIIYSIEIAISLALFYSVYWLFLKKETFFKLNRFYLMSSVIIALLIPLLNISIGDRIVKNSLVTEYLTAPIEQYEQNIRNIGGNPASGNSEGITFPGGVHWENKGTNPDYGSTDPDAVQPLVPVSYQATHSDKWNTLSVVLLIYFIGVAFFFIRFIFNLILIFKYSSQHQAQEIFGMNVIRMKKSSSPFSFLNLIYIGQTEYPEEELIKIISHEKIHIEQKHSVDLILLEIVLIFQWFNPFVWLYKRSVKITHEYLADQGTLRSGIDLKSYQYSLLNQILRENNFEIASNYNLTIKKRIAMMIKKRSNKIAALKLVIALPIICFLLGAFAFKANYTKSVVAPDSYEIIKVAGGKDTLIKEEKVSIEYLKLLEGEYVFTKGSMGKKIKFTEVLGRLMGNDNGYRYQLIPVGNGKFVNPDDGTPIVFNTSDKNAITLLLLENTFKKTDASNETAGSKKSVAYSLARIIEKDGIGAALSNYKEIKNSAMYDLNEIEMNLVGYQLLHIGKTKDAASVLKLNTEAFPKSFRTYTGYADALLALGDKKQAIENYRKSVQLNPGSKDALKKLKELGVSTDDLVKKVNVPMDYLKLVQGYYFSTNETWGIRKIQITEESGTLVGIDNGYRYKLLPVGDGKFINPDDGAELVFDTKDKNAITLLLFGTINLKKLNTEETNITVSNFIKRVKVSDEYLKSLEGEYVSSDDPNGVRKIRFVQEQGELIGNDNGYRYKVIPIGDGKFINPDDGASLVFDTKNKNAVNLLLFGRINLKKVE